MKAFAIFNLCVLSVTLLLSVAYYVIYKRYIKEKTRIFTPLRVLSVVITVALLTSVAGNLYYLHKKEKELQFLVNPCNVNICAVNDEETSVDGVFAKLVSENAIPGYSTTVQRVDDIQYTYYLGKIHELRQCPDFIVFVEYVGEENTNYLRWGATRVKWLSDGKMQGDCFASGDYFSNKLVMIGNTEASVEELQIKISYYLENDQDVWHDVSFAIQLNTDKE